MKREEGRKKNEEEMPLVIIGAMMIGIPALVIGAASWPIVILLGLSGLLIGALRGRGDHSWRRIAAIAAVLGTVGEAICVFPAWYPDGRGLWEYRFPNPFGLSGELPIWLPLVWANLFVLFVALARRVPTRSGGTWPGGVHFLAVLVIVAHAFAIARVVRIEILYGLVPLFSAFLLWWNTPRDLTVYGIAAILGSCGEILAMREGLWIYTAPFFQAGFLLAHGIPGVPISLPMAWGLCAVLVRRWGTVEPAS